VSVRILHGNCRLILPTLSAASVQCCVTSPPYFGLRDYGVAGQIGLEPTPDDYVAEMVAVFREVRRVLRDDGVLWLNLGDSYAGHNIGAFRPGNESKNQGASNKNGVGYVDGCKPKDLIGIPWMVAFALRADGWFLRSDCIWAKPNPMPESVTDRPTKAHEYVFLLTKSARYFWDADAVAEQALTPDRVREKMNGESAVDTKLRGFGSHCGTVDGSRNIRTVWTIATQPYSGSHFATMPPALAERCIKAGSAPGDTILDPFSGAGTTALVADRLGRSAIGIELNQDYAAMGSDRVRDDLPLFAQVSSL
jgi:DNA modification methylase